MSKSRNNDYRRWRDSVVAPLVVALVLISGVVLGVPVLGGLQAIAGAALTPFQQNCPGLIGTTDWQGQWQVTSGPTASGTWSGTITLDDNGDVSGTISYVETMGAYQGFADSGPAGGSMSSNCSSLYLDANFSSTGPVQMVAATTVTVPPGTNTLSFANASYDVTNNGSSGTASGTGTPLPSVTANAAPDYATNPGDYDVSVIGTGPSLPPPTPTGSVILSDGVDSCVVSLPADSCVLADEVPGSSYTVTGTYISGDTNYASFTAGSATVEVGLGTNAQTPMLADGVSVKASGGGASDTVSEIAYSTDPVAALTDGMNYFDVAVSQLSPQFGDVVVTECNSGVTTSTTLDWWDTTTNLWVAVSGAPGPTYSNSNGTECVSYTLSDTPPTDPTLAQLNHTVFGVVADGSAIDSISSADATTATPFSLIVTTVGSPTPSITEVGKLPKGLRLRDHHNGTATLSGTPRRTSGGLYQPTITAAYGSGANRRVVQQVFTLFVFQAPTMKGRLHSHAHVGSPYSASVTAKGYPLPTISESGALPPGIVFTNDASAAATLTGTPDAGSAGTYPITITASNGEGSPVSRSFNLVVRN